MTEQEPAQAAVEPSSRRALVRLLPRSSWGLAGAALLWIAGLAPSLLPRPPVVAIGLAGLLAWCGYGLGCLVGAVLGRLLRSRPRARRTADRAGWTVAVVLGAGLAVGAHIATGWQSEQAAALGMSDPGLPGWALLLGGVVLLVVLVLVGRGLRGVARRVSRAVSRRASRPVAATVGVVSSVALVAALVGFAYVITERGFARINEQGSGQPAPTSALRSGGPGSLVSYDGLGTEGQEFVDGGPTTSQISAYTGKPALEPVRVFVGVDNASTPQERASLAVQELQRTGGLQRRLLVVAVSTGNGFLDPDLVSAPELLEGGDVATVSIQYSVLPSWLSFLVDRSAAGEASTALWDAVESAVAALPEDQRPLVAVSGESLGAFGGQVPFAGQSPQQVVGEAGAVVWVGSPGSSAVWPVWRDERSSGPEWQPVIGDGSIARNPASASSETWTAPGWGERRAVLTQHANDPVSWWSVDLFLHRPAWLDTPRGPGVDLRTTWWPGVLFLQTGLDLATAGAVPAGVGHNYGDVTGQAWAYALDASGADGAWTDADTARLQKALSGS
ncbi:MAG: alpha/beta-hydrolase family protein [Candidatus Nanopelagicales bacterium]